MPTYSRAQVYAMQCTLAQVFSVIENCIPTANLIQMCVLRWIFHVRAVWMQIAVTQCVPCECNPTHTPTHIATHTPTRKSATVHPHRTSIPNIHLYRTFQSVQPTGWLRLVGSLKLQVSFAKEPYKRDDILQKRLIILSSLPIVVTPYLVGRLCVLDGFYFPQILPKT